MVPADVEHRAQAIQGANLSGLFRECNKMLIRADARLLPLHDGCVQCCVTSPPYWNLRDYGTAQWKGGDMKCSHVQRMARGDAGRISTDDRTGVNPTPVETPMFFRDICGKCGARRIDQQIGLEPTPDAYVQTLVQALREVWRVLKPDGTCWLNLGDSYAHSLRQSGTAHAGEKQNTNNWSIRSGFKPLPQGLKEKDLVGIPWRVAFALQADGWYLRSDIIWEKKNPMPESVTDRPTKAHEYLFLLAKAERYYYDSDAIREDLSPTAHYGGTYRADHKLNRSGVGSPQGSFKAGFTIEPDPSGRNKRSVWSVATQPYTEAHFATWPPKLIEPCILAGSRPGDLVLDPFIGSGTTGQVCERLGRRWVGCDLTYQHLAKTRTAQRGLQFIDEASA